MLARRLPLLFLGLLLAQGCTWPVHPQTDNWVCQMADLPYDVSPQRAGDPSKGDGKAGATEGRPSSEIRQGADATEPPEASFDVQAAAWMQPQSEPLRREQLQDDDGDQAGDRPGRWKRPVELKLPSRLPGSEAAPLPKGKGEIERQIDTIFGEMPALPVEPDVQPGPDGTGFTLNELQRIAAANSPALRQAISDVQAARGNLLQAKTYPNPTTGYLIDPTNNNATAGVQGMFIDQPIRTGGKQKLGVAAAQRNLENAQLALRRARSDLATAVRSAYFSLVVDQETLEVLRAVAGFSDEIYRLQVRLLQGALTAPYEPTALRAQANATRLAYKQAIATYIYDWKQLVATLSVEQLPMSKVAGEVDRFIPYYDYDQVLAYVKRNHTDILAARNLVPIARYNLKLAQVTPWLPDIDVRMQWEKDYTLAPFGTYKTLGVGMPLPIWDQNKGNIVAAQAALIRASEESHRVEVGLTYNLGQAYTNYKNNLYALESYRRSILPDLVRYYRGIYSRRQVDPNASFGDLVFAQQNLSQNVIAYLGVLGSTWSSVVALADFLQTNDLFQLATPRELPDLPDLNQLNRWPCGHPALAASCNRGKTPGDEDARREGETNKKAPLRPKGDERSEPSSRKQSAAGAPLDAARPEAPRRLTGKGYLRDKGLRVESPTSQPRGERLEGAPAKAAESRDEEQPQHGAGTLTVR